MSGLEKVLSDLKADRNESRWLELTAITEDVDEVAGEVAVAYALAGDSSRRSQINQLLAETLRCTGSGVADDGEQELNLGLGFLSNTSPSVSLQIRIREAWHTLECAQDPSYLRAGQAATVDSASLRAARGTRSRGTRGVTGAVVWRTTPVTLSFLAGESWFAQMVCGEPGSADSSSRPTTIIELGCGVAGLTPRLLRTAFPNAKIRFILTDHDDRLLKLSRRNVGRGCRTSSSDSAPSDVGDDIQSIEYMQLDWHDPPAVYLPALDRLMSKDCIGGDNNTATVIVLALDCVYNTVLARAFNDTLFAIMNHICDRGHRALAVIGQQCREEVLHAGWLADLCGHKSFVTEVPAGESGRKRQDTFPRRRIPHLWVFDDHYPQSVPGDEVCQAMNTARLNGQGCLPHGFNVYALELI
ncbi:Ribosomal protein lysine methyltransferase [Savitreella phatthalungensis]